MYSQKMRLLCLNLALVMLFTLVPVQAVGTAAGSDGPLYTVVFNGNGGTNEGDDTLSVGFGTSPLCIENYVFVRPGYTFLGWSQNAGADTITYTRFDYVYDTAFGIASIEKHFQ